MSVGVSGVSSFGSTSYSVMLVCLVNFPKTHLFLYRAYNYAHTLMHKRRKRTETGGWEEGITCRALSSVMNEGDGHVTTRDGEGGRGIEATECCML